MQKQKETVIKMEQENKERQQVRFMAYQTAYFNLQERATGGKC